MQRAKLIKKSGIFIALAIATAAIYFLDFRFDNINLDKWYRTFFGFTVLYGVYELLKELISTRIKDAKARYSLRKILGFVLGLISIFTVVRIWTPDPQSLLVAYGLVGAGVAVALQDLFKNFAGGLFIFFNGVFKVGDRIEIDQSYGDVMDIGLMNTTILEIRNWVDGDQATGRITVIPNSYVLSKPVNNYTKDHNFIWDEIQIPITFGSNWQKAITIIEKILIESTKEITEKAGKQIARIQERYYLSQHNLEPGIYITPNDNWINFSIRYITDVRERRITQSDISKLITKAIQAESDIKFASATFEVVGLPTVNLHNQ